ncbi:MAG: hypothetical protein K0V04_20420 [Deltaproteobacteria bacterium]|nr:hypothetical protein [Deltaproteobacteria bacterium]
MWGRPRAGSIVLGLLVASGCPTTASDRQLRLSVDASDVEPRLAELGVLSVEVYGVRDTTTLCTLARRCLYPQDLGNPQTSAQLQGALRSIEPLVEVDADVAHQLAVVGRVGGLCDAQGPFLLCGFADLATASGNDLTIGLADAQCPDTLPDFCPP